MESGSLSGFDSDAGDVAAVDWTLPRDAPVAEQDEEETARPGAAAPAAADDAARPTDGGVAATTPASTSSSGWLDEEEGGSSSDEWGDVDEDEGEDGEDDEDEDEDEDSEQEEEEEEEEPEAAAADADADRPTTPTHARLLRLAYTAGSRMAGAAAPAAQTAQQQQQQQQPQHPQPPRRPEVLQCAIAPLPVPRKPLHPPLLQSLNAAVAGNVAPRRGGGGGGGMSLDRRGGRGMTLSACRRALLRGGRASGRAAGAQAAGLAGWGSSLSDEEEGGGDGDGGGSSSSRADMDDDDDDEQQEEEEEDDDDDQQERPEAGTLTTPQRRSARLAAAADRAGRDGGGCSDGSGNGDDAAGARDQEQQQQQQQQQRRRSGATDKRAAAANGRRRRPRTSPSSSSSLTVLNTARLILARDLGLGAGRGGALSRAQRLHASALPPARALPTVPCRVRDQTASRAYVGQFSADGSLFVAAFQDRRVRLYDVGTPGGGDAGAGADDDGAASVARRGGDATSPRHPSSPASSPGRFYTRWRLRKDISTRLTRWTVTDTALSPDGRYLVYSSITPVVWLVDVGAPYDASRVESRANETQVHDALSFAGPPPGAAQGGGGGQGGGDDDPRQQHHHRNFGVWSVAWAPGAAGELVAGTSDRSALVYDMGAGRAVARMGGHGDDVNAVAHLDPLSPHLVVTGSDDALVRLWDRRVGGRGAGGAGGGVASARRAAGEQQPSQPQQQQRQHQQQQLSQTSEPIGVWIGHTEGLTHLCPRGDGRLLLSNAKDQTARAWDARSGLRPPSEARALPPVRGGRGSGYDYRWEAYPYRGHAVAHPHDGSVQVYRGHSVLQSLVRAYWSPEESTGGRYVYAGSADGAAVIWDAATAEVVARLSGAHGAVVRDVAWHPREPAIVTASWDGSLVEWRAPGGGGA